MRHTQALELLAPAGRASSDGALRRADRTKFAPERHRSAFSRALHSSYRNDVVSQHANFHICILENDLQHIGN